jgi:hypothetical protein
MRVRGWSKVKLAQMWIIDEALAKMSAELPIDLPKVQSSRKAA